MSYIDKEKKYPLYSALCFAVYTLLEIIPNITSFYYGDDLSTTASILLWIGLIGLTITIFIRNKKAVLISAGITGLAYLLSNIRYFPFYSILTLLSYITFIFVILLSGKEDKRVKRTWFLPSLLSIVSCIFIITYYHYDFFNTPPYNWSYSGWAQLLTALFKTAAIFFACLWLKEDLSPIVFRSSSKKPVSAATVSEIGGAEKLKAIKELLDTGAITQEEFEQKKKQILG